MSILERLMKIVGTEKPEVVSVYRCCLCNKILQSGTECRSTKFCWERRHPKIVIEKPSLGKVNRRKGKANRKNRGRFR